MPQPSKSLVTGIIVIIGVLVVVLVNMGLGLFKPSTIDTVAARAKGNPQAPLKIVEFIDLQCPACASGSVVLRNYFKQYPQKIRLELQYFPLSTHRHGFRSALYNECAAAQGQFWSFNERVLDHQSQWKDLINADALFEQFAKELGLNLHQLNKCLQDEHIRELIMKDKQQGESLGIKSTPTYFVNGKMVVGTKSLQQELDQFFGIASTPAP